MNWVKNLTEAQAALLVGIISVTPALMGGLCGFLGGLISTPPADTIVGKADFAVDSREREWQKFTTDLGPGSYRLKAIGKWTLEVANKQGQILGPEGRDLIVSDPKDDNNLFCSEHKVGALLYKLGKNGVCSSVVDSPEFTIPQNTPIFFAMNDGRELPNVSNKSKTIPGTNGYDGNFGWMFVTIYKRSLQIVR
ncbi:MAG: hypothetical protein K2Y32_19520 [Candidatus Obscuribacterales bacterium]|jgi:hypothetical protein|nr:hypothetical protein [Candidatus Obscuribacterales bacterium]